MKEQSISEVLKVYNSSIHPVSESLSDAVCIQWVKVVEVLLKTGTCIPLAKVDRLHNVESLCLIVLLTLVSLFLHEVTRIKRKLGHVSIIGKQLSAKHVIEKCGYLPF